MNNDIWSAIVSVFTGKGGTIRLTIAGSLFAAIVYEILDARYNFSFTNKDTAVSLTPSGEMPQHALHPERCGDAFEQEMADGGATMEPQQVLAV